MALEIPEGLFDYDDYAALDDGNRYQVIDGVLVMTPAPSMWHQELLLRLAFELETYARAHPGGKVMIAPFDVVLRAERPATVLQPDLLYLSPARLNRLTAKNLQDSPDLAVEVLSASTGVLDLTRKAALYARHGVTEFWAVDSRRARVEVRRREDDGKFGRPRVLARKDALESPLLPGFRLSLETLYKPEPAFDELEESGDDF